TYFFYLIAGAASMLALVAWSTLRDMRNKIRSYAEAEMARLTREYESRPPHPVRQMRYKPKTPAPKQEHIDRTNALHSLWLKASKEPVPDAKVALYDRILELRPEDTEALAWKADAVLELGEHRWALSLCERVLEIDPDDAHALYQRACAWAGLGETDHALEDLAAALTLSEGLRDTARQEPHFAGLRDMREFYMLVPPEPD